MLVTSFAYSGDGSALQDGDWSWTNWFQHTFSILCWPYTSAISGTNIQFQCICTIYKCKLYISHMRLRSDAHSHLLNVSSQDLAYCRQDSEASIYLQIVCTKHVQKAKLGSRSAQGADGEFKGNLKINLMRFHISVVYGQH